MKKWLFVFVALFSGVTLTAQDSLLANFRQPPALAKPRVWWHWMSGNITQEGIRKELLWMHRSGIGGFQNFDANMMTPQITAKRLVYMTPEWQDAFRLTTKLADSLKLENQAGTSGRKQFLFDLRKTLGEMVVEYHYDGLTEILKGYGMKRYTESYEDERRGGEADPSISR